MKKILLQRVALPAGIYVLAAGFAGVAAAAATGSQVVANLIALTVFIFGCGNILLAVHSWDDK